MSDGMEYVFKEFIIPEYMHSGIELYVKMGVRPGNFFMQVLCNNLVEAVAAADKENMRNLPAYANYLYNYLPHDAWGSEKVVLEWMTKKQKEAKDARTS